MGWTQRAGTREDPYELGPVEVVGHRRPSGGGSSARPMPSRMSAIPRVPGLVDERGEPVDSVHTEEKTEVQQKKEEEPCPGDPVPHPEIAPQTASSVRGGMFGFTRKKKDGAPKWHNGVDFKNPYGAPDYAMYDGVATLHTEVAGAGYYVTAASEIGGRQVEILYFHMQKERRVSGVVKAGDIIGYQGDSGNLKEAIRKGKTVSHVHIKVRVAGETVDPLPYLATEIDPETGGVTQPCE